MMPDWKNIVINIAKESGKTFQEFIPVEIKFLDSVEFYLDYCNNLLLKNKDNIIKKLINILDEHK